MILFDGYNLLFMRPSSTHVKYSLLVILSAALALPLAPATPLGHVWQPLARPCPSLDLGPGLGQKNKPWLVSHSSKNKRFRVSYIPFHPKIMVDGF